MNTEQLRNDQYINEWFMMQDLRNAMRERYLEGMDNYLELTKKPQWIRP